MLSALVPHRAIFALKSATQSQRNHLKKLFGTVNQLESAIKQTITQSKTRKVFGCGQSAAHVTPSDVIEHRKKEDEENKRAISEKETFKSKEKKLFEKNKKLEEELKGVREFKREVGRRNSRMMSELEVDENQMIEKEDTEKERQSVYAEVVDPVVEEDRVGIYSGVWAMKDEKVVNLQD